MSVRNALKWPMWFAELFTTTKSFAANPIIGNRTLNRFGLHVARAQAAHTMTAWRRLLMRGIVSKEVRESYRRDGYVIVENFLDADHFDQLRSEVVTFDGDMRRMMQGDTATYQGLLDDETVQRMPVTSRLLCSSAFQSLLMYGGATYKLPMFFAHCVVNGIRKGEPDPQRDFHSDTFHPTMKAWLFLDDVDDEIGPFNYVPGSHRFDSARRAWDYENSIVGRDLDNRYAQRGSLRIAPDELKARGFSEPMAFKVPANTLVMADMHGFHRRGDAQSGTSRLAIHAYSCANPFNPFPALGPVNWRAKIDQWFTRRALKAADRKAAVRGLPPFWAPVDKAELARHVQVRPTGVVSAEDAHHTAASSLGSATPPAA